MVSLRKRTHSGTGPPSVEVGASGEAVPKTDVAPSDINEETKAGPSGSISPTADTPVSPSSSSRKKKRFCSCKGEDDGRPMVHCEGVCKDW